MTNTTPEETQVNGVVFPIGEENTEIVLKDEFGEPHVTSLAELRPGDATLAPTNASYNIEHSTDVIVGPVTQFYAPVTIYQNVNGQINGTVQNNEDIPISFKEKREDLDESKRPPQNNNTARYTNNADTKENKDKFKLVPIKLAVYVCLGIAVAVLCGGVVYTIILVSHRSPINPPINPPTTPVPDVTDTPNPEPGLKLIDKQQWGGWPAKNFTALKHPVPFVIIKHTVTSFLTTFSRCSQRIKDMQADHQKRFSDISYNFLICGDNNIYIGRGWMVQNLQRPEDSIDISFVGNFNQDKLTAGMIKAAQDLISYGVAMGYISSEYKLVGHKQMMATQSPGTNVMEEISHWPHYDGLKYY